MINTTSYKNDTPMSLPASRSVLQSSCAGWLPLLAVFVIALVPKLVFMHNVEISAGKKDARLYLDIATNLWNTGTFGTKAGEPDARVAPLYMLFLAPFAGLFGDEPLPALYVQSVLGSLCACIAYLLARKSHGELAGWLAALFCASYVPMMKFPSKFLTETLAATLCFAGLYAGDRVLAARGVGRQSLWSFLTGAVYALASLTRFVNLPLLFAPAVVWAWRDRSNPSQAVRTVVFAVLGLILVYSPWVVRNAVSLGEPIVLGKGHSIERRPYIVSENILAGDSYWEADGKYQQLHDEGRLPEIQLSRRSSRYWRHCWVRFQMMLAVHPCLELPFPFAGQPVFAPPLIKQFNHVWSLGMWLSTFCALLYAVGRGDVRLLHLIAVPLGLMVLYSLVHVVPRYQAVCYFTLSAAAGIGLSAALQASAAFLPRTVPNSSRI